MDNDVTCRKTGVVPGMSTPPLVTVKQGVFLARTLLPVWESSAQGAQWCKPQKIEYSD